MSVRSAVTKTAPHDTYDHWRETALEGVAKCALPQLSRAELYKLELFPGYPVGGLKFVIPKTMVPPGSARTAYFRTVNLMDGIPNLASIPQHFIDDILHVLRITVTAALLVPRDSRGRRGYLPKPRTWVAFCRQFLKLSKWALTHRPNPTRIFEHLSFSDLAQAVAGTSKSMGWTISTLSKLKAANAIVDWPNIPLGLEDIYQLVGMPNLVKTPIGNPKAVYPGSAPHSLHLRTKESEHLPQLRESYKPLPDQFVTEAGWRIIWFIENIGPNLIHLRNKFEALTTSIGEAARANQCSSILRQHIWIGPDGSPLDNIPFKIILGNEGSRQHAIIHNLRYVAIERQVDELAYLLQLCHIYVVSFCMGSRISELLSLTWDSLAEYQSIDDSGTRVIGRTYKLASVTEGKVRDWPLHSIGAEAIRQQNRLVSKMRKPGVNALWIQFKTASIGADRAERGDPLNNLSLNRIVQMLDLQSYIDERGLHHHRFRKTIARLGALALVGSPKILMDLFGHNSIRMTLLDYILSDPAIAAEIDQVSRDITLMNSKEVLLSPEDHGGRAGERLKALEWGKAARGEAELGVADIDEAAKILTLNGRSWIMVRPNVLCTKSPQQAGPCTRAVGYPEPSRCQADCDNRLELSAAQQDVHKSIECSVDKLASISDWDGDHEAKFWIGQLRHHLLRFDNVTKRWESHPVIVRLRQWEASNGLS